MLHNALADWADSDLQSFAGGGSGAVAAACGRAFDQDLLPS